MGLQERLKNAKFIAVFVLASTVGSACIPAEEITTLKKSYSTDIKPIAALSVPNNVPPSNDFGVSKVVAGYQHVCAIRSGKLYCWGLNESGQIGNGESGMNGPDPKTVNQPVEVIASQVSDVAVGYEHTCAIHQGDLKCWGSNEYGQLGIGVGPNPAGGNFATELTQPTQILQNITQVVARARYTCAINVAGKLYCWGTRLAHHGANLEPRRISNTPKEILSQDVTKIALSDKHLCAIVGSQNALKCLGVNLMGEIGNGDTSGADVDVFYEVFSSGVEQVALSDHRTCAVVNGSMKCFGMSIADRQIDSAPGGGWRVPNFTPYDATFWNGVAPGKKISASGAVLASDDRLFYGSYFHMNGLPNAVALGIRDFSFSESDLVGCMMFINQQVKCWGSNVFGQLGIGVKSEIEPPITQAQDVVF